MVDITEELFCGNAAHLPVWEAMMGFIVDVTGLKARFKIGITNDPSARAQQATYKGKFSYMFAMGASESRDRIAATEAALVGFALRHPSLRNLLLNDPSAAGETLDQAKNLDSPGVKHFVYVCLKGTPAVVF